MLFRSLAWRKRAEEAEAEGDKNSGGGCKLGEPLMHGPQPYEWCATHSRLMLTCKAQKNSGEGGTQPFSPTGTVDKNSSLSMFQSAVSGLWYENPDAAGDISKIKIGSRTYRVESKGDG